MDFFSIKNGTRDWGKCVSIETDTLEFVTSGEFCNGSNYENDTHGCCTGYPPPKKKTP